MSTQFIGALERVFKYTQTSLNFLPFQSHDLQMQFFEQGTSPKAFVVFYKGRAGRILLGG